MNRPTSGPRALLSQLTRCERQRFFSPPRVMWVYVPAEQ
jgi:hypothetical protein